MKKTRDNQTKGREVTLFCDVGNSACDHLVDRFKESDFAIKRVDSGRDTPVAEFNGQYHTGARQIIMRFFPKS